MSGGGDGGSRVRRLDAERHVQIGIGGESGVRGAGRFLSAGGPPPGLRLVPVQDRPRAAAAGESGQ